MPPPDSETPSRIETLVDAAMPRIVEVTADFEFATFQTGCKIPRDMAKLPETERESFRYEARLALLRRLESMWPARRLKGVGHDVKVTLLPDAPRGVAIFVEPLFVAGRYRKLVRGLSQTVFHCRTCRARRRDCAACGGSGRFVAEAVEDFVKPPIADALRARRASFHGSGREDVDVRMLGRGRPFVVSVQWARLRSIDAAAVAREVERVSAGRVTVSGLRVVSREEARRITDEHGEKTYRALVRTTGGAMPPDASERLASLVGAEIRQRTPERVERRRADIVRVRRVLAIEVLELSGGEAEVLVRTQAGTYVKELVSGDSGRTEPSFATVLGQPCECEELDVVSAGDVDSAGAAGGGASAPGSAL
jgi:tRNA pseudouridine synthase 10